MIAVLLVNVFLAILMSAWDDMSKQELEVKLRPGFIHPPISGKLRYRLIRLPKAAWEIANEECIRIWLGHTPGLSHWLRPATAKAIQHSASRPGGMKPWLRAQEAVGIDNAPQKGGDTPVSRVLFESHLCAYMPADHAQAICDSIWFRTSAKEKARKQKAKERKQALDDANRQHAADGKSPNSHVSPISMQPLDASRPRGPLSLPGQDVPGQDLSLPGAARHAGEGSPGAARGVVLVAGGDRGEEDMVMTVERAQSIRDAMFIDSSDDEEHTMPELVSPTSNPLGTMRHSDHLDRLLTAEKVKAFESFRPSASSFVKGVTKFG